MFSIRSRRIAEKGREIQRDFPALEPVFTTVERRLSGLFPAVLRRFSLPYVSMAVENLLV